MRGTAAGVRQVYLFIAEGRRRRRLAPGICSESVGRTIGSFCGTAAMRGEAVALGKEIRGDEGTEAEFRRRRDTWTSLQDTGTRLWQFPY